MDKEEAKRRVSGVLNPDLGIDAGVAIRAIVTDDQVVIAQLRAEFNRLSARQAMYDAEIDACRTEKEIEAVLSTVKRA